MLCNFREKISITDDPISYQCPVTGRSCDGMFCIFSIIDKKLDELLKSINKVDDGKTDGYCDNCRTDDNG